MNTRPAEYKLPLFEKLFGEGSDEVYAAFREKAELRKLKAGDFMFRKGDAAKSVHMILSGIARMHAFPASHGSFIIRFLKEGDMAGILEAFNHLPHQYTATVHSKYLELATLEVDVFMELLRELPEFGLQVMRQVDKDASFIEMRVADIRSQRVTDRIEGMARAMKGKFGTDEKGRINIDITPGNIAQMIGATRTTVYRSLKKLEEEGIMRLQNRRIEPLKELVP